MLAGKPVKEGATHLWLLEVGQFHLFTYSGSPSRTGCTHGRLGQLKSYFNNFHILAISFSPDKLHSAELLHYNNLKRALPLAKLERGIGIEDGAPTHLVVRRVGLVVPLLLLPLDVLQLGLRLERGTLKLKGHARHLQQGR